MRNLIDHPLFLLILVLLVVLLFGAKRLPDAARSIGRSMRIFKSEVKEMKDDDKRPSSSASGSGSASSTGATSTEHEGSSVAAPRPLEGRVVDDAERREGSYDSQQPRRSA